MEKESINLNSYDIAQLTSIAYIVGAFEQSKKIDLPEEFTRDIEAMNNLYVSLLDVWSNGLDTGIFKNEEEEGYIEAFAQRILIERYGV